jgi:hypothetical protein
MRNSVAWIYADAKRGLKKATTGITVRCCALAANGHAAAEAPRRVMKSRRLM